MILRGLVPAGCPDVDLESPTAGRQLAAIYAPPMSRWLRTNLVAGVDGGARGHDGTSDSLASPADRRILGAIRRAADVVLVGAATVRAEGFRVPKTARLAVVTASGDVGSATLAPHDAQRVTVFCPASARDRIAGRLAEAGVWDDRVVGLSASEGVIDVSELVSELRATGAESIVCEGGPRLAGGLLDAGLVDELCLTLSPVLAGSSGPVFAGGGTGATLALSGLLSDADGMLYGRWRVSDRAQPATG